MSCYWHIRCLSCGDTLRFDNANRREDTMKALCAMGSALAELGVAKRVVETTTKGLVDLDVICSWQERVDLEWFTVHGAHELEPVNEYGELARDYDRRAARP